MRSILERSSHKEHFFEYILALCGLYAMAVFFYGQRVLILAVIAVLTTFVSDFIITHLSGRRQEEHGMAVITSALMLTLMLPASVPYWVVVIGCLTMILIAKLPFGDYYLMPFNMAAVGFCFLALGFPGYIFSYPQPFDPLPVSPEVSVPLFDGVAKVIQSGGIPKVRYMEIAMGAVPGPMGTTGVLVIVACALFLLSRKRIKFDIMAAAVLTVTLFAAIFQRTSTSIRASIGLELTSGMFLFATVFLLTDFARTPIRRFPRILSGILFGTLTMLFRYFSGFEEGALFALILVNAMVSPVEYAAGWIRTQIKKRIGKGKAVRYDRIRRKTIK